ncbi:MAG: hypothetical protein K0S22_2322 [Oscillospiraceae bacterium]|jgi:hypothetical protein|nr:hypothetical protein [Oscillospiraceae bacterium]
MQLLDFDNTISKLYNIILLLKEQGIHTKTRIAFIEVFEVNEEQNNSKIEKYYLQLFEMCNDAIRQLDSTTSKNKNFHQDTIYQIIQGLSKINFNGDLTYFIQFFDELKMQNIRNLAYTLNEFVENPKVELEQINILTTQLDSLCKEIMAANINNDLKYTLTCYIESARLSLVNYSIFGAESVRKRTIMTLGEVVIQSNYSENQTTESKSIIIEVLKALTNITVFFNFINTSGPLIGKTIEKVLSLTDKL